MRVLIPDPKSRRSSFVLVFSRNQWNTLSTFRIRESSEKDVATLLPACLILTGGYSRNPAAQVLIDGGFGRDYSQGEGVFYSRKIEE